MRTSKGKRILSLLMALLVAAPTVFGILPQISTPVSAAYTDAGELGAGKTGQLVDGIYEIRIKGQNLAMGYDATSPNENTLIKLQTANGSDTQKWIIEYAGGEDWDGSTANGYEAHYYNIRNLGSGRMLRADAGTDASDHAKFGFATGNKADDTVRWRLVYNDVDGTYGLHSWYYRGSIFRYLNPVDSIRAETAATSLNHGDYIRLLEDAVYGFELVRVPIQSYGDSALDYGTYRVTDSNGTYFWEANNSSAAVLEPHYPFDASTNWNVTHGLLYTAVANKKTNGSQLFLIDWTSQGYITISDALTGRYIGDRNSITTAYQGAISQLVDNPNTAFDDRLRFYWIPIPAYSGITRLDNQFYLCNVLTGNVMYLNTGLVTVSNTKGNGQMWAFTSMSVEDIGTESQSQGYNGNTGVYLDSFDFSDTIRLPIKIYDYVNDGMLFEYAQSNAGGSSSSDTSDWLSWNGKTYFTGNNLAFSLLTGSNGGEWNGRGGYYYPYLDNGSTSALGNNPGAWNTYETFSVGYMWFKYTNSGSGFYASGSSTVSNNYFWEKHGLGNFRSGLADTTDNAASVYMIYGLTPNSPQGLNKTTYNVDGVTTTTSFTRSLYSGDTVVNKNGSSYYLTYTGYPYDLFGYLQGTATIGLVKAELNPITGAPEYRDVVVEYLADLLKKALAVPEYNSTTAEYAYNYVNGANHERYGTDDNGLAYRGLDDWLRSRMKGEGYAMGSYAATYAKRENLIGTWDECKDYIRTYCDAAYFMLNNLFVPYSYNEPQDMFDYLELTNVKMDGDDGTIKDAYVFDSGFTTHGTSSNSQSAVYYDTVEKVIRNTQVTGKANAFLNSTTNYACAHPFLPVWETLDMATQTGTQNTTLSPYFNDDGVSEPSADATATYQNRNFNYVLASNGEFQYSYDDELFFNFEGDDDVYLFINGQLVMDLGAAHGVAGFTLNLNDYVDDARAAVADGNATPRDYALNLVEGGIYSFDFYYMERHGWGSNMRIATNIRVVEKGMLVGKDGAQMDTDLDTNDMIEPAEPVEYSFTLTNSGTEDLIWPTFTDSKIGVTISYNGGLSVTGNNGVTVMDKNGGALDVTDLVVTYTNPKTGNTSRRTFANQQALINYLTNELVIETQEKSTPPFGVLTISGIYYKLTQAQIEEGVFTNTVDVTAFVRNSATSKAPYNVAVPDSSASVRNPFVGDGTQALVPGQIVYENSGTTDRVMPYINVIDKLRLNPEEGFWINTSAGFVDANGDALDVWDLTFTYTAPDGTTARYTFTSNEELRQFLLHTLVVEPGGKLEVDGIYFNTAVNDTVIINTLERAATSTDSANTSTGSQLEDSADFTVFVPNMPTYYHWRDHELVIDESILVADMKTMAADPGNPLSQIFMPTVKDIRVLTLADKDGNPITSDEAWVSGKNVHAKYQTTGIKQIYLNVDYSYVTNGLTKYSTATVPVQINVLDVESYTFVLDYGLHLELTYEDLFGSDVLELEKLESVFELAGATNERDEPYYGSNNVNGFRPMVDGEGNLIWSWDASTADGLKIDGDVGMAPNASGKELFLIYTPQQFMDGYDHVYIAVRVKDADSTATDDISVTDIRQEAEMFKKITFLPANVVYYEDDFPAVNATGTFTTNDNEHGQAQSKDQSQIYGSDSVYSGSGDVTMSGGTVSTVVISEGMTQAASFTFKGTGFELISRTNSYDSATIEVMLTNLSKAEDDPDRVRYYPVITEFDQISTTGQANASGTDVDEIYQVPVFRITDLTYGEYEVTISGIPTITGLDPETFKPVFETTYLYIDGIRIYNPMGEGGVSEYGPEQGAVFTELRDLIFRSQAAAIGLPMTDGVPSLGVTFGQHVSFTEDLRGWFNENSGDLDQFAIAGPNNEIYFDSSTGDYALVLYVAQSGEEGLLHVGVHDLWEGRFYGDEAAENEASSISYWTGESWVTIQLGTAGTEQYYPIDYLRCPEVQTENGTYRQVVIRVDSGMVSFTNVKTVGLTFGTLEKDTENVRYKYENGVLYTAPVDSEEWTVVPHYELVAATFSLRRALFSAAPEPEIPELPEEPEQIPETGDQAWWEILWELLVALVEGLLNMGEEAKP